MGRSVGKIVVEHPQCQDERHAMWIYRVSVRDGVVEFATGDFSNGVWGFFEPLPNHKM